VPGEPERQIWFSYRPARREIDSLLKRSTNTGSVDVPTVSFVSAVAGFSIPSVPALKGTEPVFLNVYGAPELN
jgi:hypothetical protein